MRRPNKGTDTMTDVMKAGRILIVAAASCTIGLLGEFQVGNSDDQGPRISFGVSEAQAAPRHAARRVGRRTTRRTVRRLTVLPVGCPLAGPYYYCGGVYYQQAVEGGQTVYIVVTP